MSLATANDGQHVPHFFTVVQWNAIDLENRFLLTLFLIERNNLDAFTIVVLLLPCT